MKRAVKPSRPEKIGGGNEIWEVINDFPDYNISSWGRVKSLKFGKERILKPGTNRDGYLYVVLSNGIATKTIGVHQLVAKAFVPNPKRYPCALHKDDVKRNNFPSNLKWGTQQHNNEDCVRNGKHKSMHGRKHTPETIEKMRQARKRWHRFIGFSEESICRMRDAKLGRRNRG